jgi:GNAT superfamily N-acetyltransferase
MIKIKEIKAEDTFPIRKEVLRKGMTLSHELPGDHDADTVHLGVFWDGQLICIGSFMKASKLPFSGFQYQLRGMATANGFQGKGYGQILVKRAEEMLKARGVELIWCNARVSALDFYRKLGYETTGAVFDVPQVGPHYMMFKKLRNSL